MAYTDVWDVTSPLDTQAANQGAADFRATKLDVMQRIASFGAGVIANRPTPEATSGTADWTGVMYWATDTKQVFMWNGSAWVDISADIPTVQPESFSDTTVNTFTAPLASGVLRIANVITIPSGVLNTGSVLLINARFAATYTGTPSTGPQAAISLEFNGNVPFFSFLTYPDATNSYAIEAALTLVSPTSLVGVFRGYANGVAPYIGLIAATIADVTANPLVIATKLDTGVAGHTNQNTIVIDMLTATVN